jgi:hypothetical protein
MKDKIEQIITDYEKDIQEYLGSPISWDNYYFDIPYKLSMMKDEILKVINDERYYVYHYNNPTTILV